MRMPFGSRLPSAAGWSSLLTDVYIQGPRDIAKILALAGLTMHGKTAQLDFQE